MSQGQVEQYWQTYLASLPDTVCKTEPYEADQFGDNAVPRYAFSV